MHASTLAVGADQNLDIIQQLVHCRCDCLSCAPEVGDTLKAMVRLLLGEAFHAALAVNADQNPDVKVRDLHPAQPSQQVWPVSPPSRRSCRLCRLCRGLDSLSRGNTKTF